jgi:O-succinylbenzoate synthase
VALPLVTPFVTAHGRETHSRFWLVGVHADGVTGWAESVAQGEPLYSEETHATLHQVVVHHLVPRLFQGPLADPAAVTARFAAIRHHEMAKASLEMAVWNWYGRAAGVSLGAHWGGTRLEVPAGVVVGIPASIAELVDTVQAYVEAGYQRVKIKIQPGWDLTPLQALRSAWPALALWADANSSYTLADAAHLAQLDPLNLGLLEQPLGPDDLVDHATLQRRLATPICLDESIRSPRDARQALQLGACRVINVKPARVGGFGPALAIHAMACEQGVPLWCGGMLESGVGRAANLQLASQAGFTLPGDLSASARYFHEDLVDPPFVLTPRGTLAVPTGPGIGVEPNPTRLQRFQVGAVEWHRP